MKIDNIERVGNSLKEIRKQKGFTIVELGLYTGLSVGYLSNIERNQTSPTLRNLSIICNALRVSIADVISMGTEEKLVIKKEDSIKRKYPELKMIEEIVDFGGESGIYTYITIEPGKIKSVPNFIHPYSEVCTVIEGELTIIVEEIEYNLKKGDTIYIKKNVHHIMKNDSNKRSVSFWHRERPMIFA